MFAIPFIIIDIIITLLLYLIIIVAFLIFGLADFIEDIGKKLPNYLMNTFEKSEHPWRTAFSDFWKYYHRGIILFIIIASPFLVRRVVTMTDISSVDKPYNTVQNYINAHEDKFYYHLEEKYGYHTAKMKIAHDFPTLTKVISYPVASNRYERRLARQSAYVASQRNNNTEN